MHERATPRKASHIEDWMIDLLEDDRPAPENVRARMTDGLGWMYIASFITEN